MIKHFYLEVCGEPAEVMIFTYLLFKRHFLSGFERSPGPTLISLSLWEKTSFNFLKTRSETLSKFCEGPFKVQQIGSGNSNIFGIFTLTWQPGEMIHFDYVIFFRWVEG